MNVVVCVSEGQASKVRFAGVREDRLQVIRNSIAVDRFAAPADPGRAFLQSFFPQPRSMLIGAVGRLSPEKGFGTLVEAAAQVMQLHPDAGFLVFGDGPLRGKLTQRIAELGLRENLVLAGFRDDLDRWLANFDLTILPSYTEGLPNVVLESFAARVPVVATAVGGTPEVVDDGTNGYLVTPGLPGLLARRILDLLANEPLRRRMGLQGYRQVREHFTFAAQAQKYEALFRRLSPRSYRKDDRPLAPVAAA
jgi:glycosyltransferase involved in cell wall biosynthesis